HEGALSRALPTRFRRALVRAVCAKHLNGVARMRIAQIAPLHEAVPPKLYGGTERVVSYLTEALVELRHEVTRSARAVPQPSATLEAVWPQALRLDPTIRDTMAPPMLLLEEVRRRADEF